MNKLLSVNALLALLRCSTDNGDGNASFLMGAQRSLGLGDVYSFAEFSESDKPMVLGISFSKEALENPPEGISDGNRCFDHDGNDTIDLHTECSPWHEKALPLPASVANRDDVPFSWVLLNWNDHGHIPPGVWDDPHYDIHFYIAPIEEVFSWQRGPCGPEFMRCDQFEKATQPVGSGFMHPDYIDVGAAAPAMGNHLVDTTAAEFHGEPFTRSWIYGVYGGDVIFYEEMVAQTYLLSQPNECHVIKVSEQVALSGYYPTQTCTRYNESSGRTIVTLEDFVFRPDSMD